MKTKLLARGLLMASALIASGTASAGVFWEGTVAKWVNGTGNLTPSTGPTPSQALNQIIDANGDLKFNWLGLSGDLIGHESTIYVELSEDFLQGKEIYEAFFTFIGGYTASVGGIKYSLTALDPAQEFPSSARLDSNVRLGAELVTEQLFDPTTLFSTLTSNGGASDGYINFTPRQSIVVTDTLNANGGIIRNVSNQFDPAPTPVPAPMALPLMAIGLAALGVRRRRA